MRVEDMFTYPNYCNQCGDAWAVKAEHATLDELDYYNLQKHGTLISICEDCNGGDCISAEKEELA